jgi:hypothetical protein
MSARSRKLLGGVVVTMSSRAMAQPPAFSVRQALRTSGSAGTSSRISTTRRLLGRALA